MKNILLNLRRKKSHLLGFDISPNYIRLIELSYSNSECQIEACKQVILDESAKSEEMAVFALSGMLKQMVLGTRTVAVSLPNSHVVSKEIDLPVGLSPKEVDEFLLFNLEGYFGCSAAQVGFDYQAVKDGDVDGVTSKVRLVAVKNEYIEKWSNLFCKSGLMLEIIDIDSYALERAIRYHMKNIEGLIVIINIEFDHVLIVVLDEVNMVYCHEDFFAEDNFRTVEQILEQLNLKMLLMLSTITKIPDQLVLAGGKAMLPGLVSAIKNKFNIETTIADPFNGMSFSQNIDLEEAYKISPVMLISFGLALRAKEYGGF